MQASLQRLHSLQTFDFTASGSAIISRRATVWVNDSLLKIQLKVEEIDWGFNTQERNTRKMATQYALLQTSLPHLSSRGVCVCSVPSGVCVVCTQACVCVCARSKNLTHIINIVSM